MLAHRAHSALCLKVSTNTAIYTANEDRLLGCVFYRAGELPFFPGDVAIPPDALYSITYERIEEAQKEGGFELVGQLPKDFPAVLLKAVSDSKTLEPQRKRSLKELIQLNRR